MSDGPSNLLIKDLHRFSVLLANGSTIELEAEKNAILEGDLIFKTEPAMDGAHPSGVFIIARGQWITCAVVRNGSPLAVVNNEEGLIS